MNQALGFFVESGLQPTLTSSKKATVKCDDQIYLYTIFIMFAVFAVAIVFPMSYQEDNCHGQI